ncbi:hypothetical protein ISCGN_001260 [Ixodes scapularis]
MNKPPLPMQVLVVAGGSPVAAPYATCEPLAPLTGVKGSSPSRVWTGTLASILKPCISCPVAVCIETPPTLLALPAKPCPTPGVLQWRNNPGDCTAP